MTVRAMWNGEIIAESDQTEVVEGNHYFPAESVKMEYLSESSRRTVCPWKGVAEYFDITVDDKTNAGGRGCMLIRARPQPKSRITSPSGKVFGSNKLSGELAQR